MSFIFNSLKEGQETLNRFLQDENAILEIDKSIQTFVNSLNNGNKIFACGNGGSMCDSIHFVEELTGRYRKDRRPLAAISMGDPGHITCVSNDFGFADIFSRQVEGLGKSGDSLLAISTSGNSENVLKAVHSAKELGIKTIGLTGKDGGKLKEMADHCLIVPSQITDRIQEIHIKCIHIFIEGIERSLFPDHYA